MTLDELDKLAGEKVMGWHLDNDRFKPGIYLHEKDSKKYTDYCDGNLCSSIGFIWWHPTRNIAQAMELLSHFNNWSVQRLPSGVKFECSILTEENDILTCVASESVSETIVRACLKAEGVEC